MYRTKLPCSALLPTLAFALGVILGGCSTNDGGTAFGLSSGSSSATGGAPSLSTGIGSPTDLGQGGVPANGTVPVATTDSVWPPKQCIGEVFEGTVGAYCLGPEVGVADSTEVSNDNANSAAGCGTTIWGIVRDFITFPGNLNAEQAALVTYASKDFGTYCCNVTEGMVLPDLGADGKPVYSGTGATSTTPLMTSEADFNKWYNDVADFNIPHYIAFQLEDNGSGIFTFSAANTTTQYFPLDNTGWGNDENTQHNYSFTTEIHTQFRYQGGEIFSFTGDDDLWVFINKKLAIDLGGVHIATTKSVNLDEQAGALGLVLGNVYSMDLFGAERHSGDSNFHVETSMSFVDCGVAPPTAIF